MPVTQPTSNKAESIFFKKCILSHRVQESSGLIKVNNRLWTLNDSGGKAALYQIDEKTGKVIRTVTIKNARNRDWEDLAYDEQYLYIGDFGNNRGNRKDLKIYKISRKALGSKKSVKAKVIHFSYNDQKDFRPHTKKNNYDCEAMIAHNGKLYLFSKNWKNHKTRLYELSNKAGRHHAKYISSFNIQGMVTGATINKQSKMLLLLTYDDLLNVNIWAFTNYKGNDFFSGAKKRLHLFSPLQGQLEGITFIDQHRAYLSSEFFSRYIFTFDAALYELDFSREFK
jgi:hypothetical protein